MTTPHSWLNSHSILNMCGFQWSISLGSHVALKTPYSLSLVTTVSTMHSGKPRVKKVAGDLWSEGSPRKTLQIRDMGLQRREWKSSQVRAQKVGVPVSFGVYRIRHSRTWTGAKHPTDQQYLLRRNQRAISWAGGRVWLQPMTDKFTIWNFLHT